ncbi:MAG: TetR family transcriptional regulator [Pimelobacter sp.]|nr:TetR family transcriptional regulator [Pimelobacter sp.]
MSHRSWRRHDDATSAVDGLLDAAGTTFARLGLSRATMTDVAQAAGCSRATLYRYFPSRDALRLGFVHRATLRIAAEIVPAPAERGADEPDALVDLIVRGIAAVRADPLLAIWFEPDNMAVPIAVSQNSELLQAMTAGLAQRLDADQPSYDEIELRGAWLLRSIVSFLAMPAADTATERAMIAAFVVPLLTPRPDRQRSTR